MKKFLLSIVALCCTVVAGAQNTSQIVSAILQTGDVTTIYYGQDALKNAYNAAVNGSVITLTSGLFNSPGEIKKSVSIYGVGFEDNVTVGMQKTFINGEIRYSADSEGHVLENFVLEGVHCGTIWIKEVSCLTIAKCRFDGLGISGTGIDGTLVRQCYFNNVDGYNYQIDGLTFKNNYMYGRVDRIIPGSQLLFDHCVMSHWYRYSSASFHGIGSYTNCIIFNNHGLQANSYAEKNIFLQIPERHDNITSVNNWFGIDVATLFSDGTTIDYAENRTFELAAPDTYKGTDGTPVGVTGGDYPWYKVPSIPYVKNLNASVDGTDLKVNYVAGVGSTNPQP